MRKGGKRNILNLSLVTTFILVFYLGNQRDSKNEFVFLMNNYNDKPELPVDLRNAFLYPKQQF